MRILALPFPRNPLPACARASEPRTAPATLGHLLTGSNYNDNQKKLTGGRNGYGAKLANIFSSEFVIETCDGSRERRYRQVFRNNMSEKSAPVVTKCKPKDNWTCITFKPDLAKFNMTELEDVGLPNAGAAKLYAKLTDHDIMSVAGIVKLEATQDEVSQVLPPPCLNLFPYPWQQIRVMGSVHVTTMSVTPYVGESRAEW